MITLLFSRFHVEIPFPPAPLQLLTAIKIGFGRLKKDKDFAQPKVFHVRLDGVRKNFSEAETVVPDNSTISIIAIDVDAPKTPQYFVLEDE